MRTLITIPIYNEERYVCRVIDRVLEHGHDVLIIDDGSTDRTPELLATKPVRVIRNEPNLGYGASLREAFHAGAAGGYDWVVTMDCDEQHEPDAIPLFLDAAGEGDADIISGSRYLIRQPEDDAPPLERRNVNAAITREINERLGAVLVEAGGSLLTDSFCGFKAHRVEAMRRLHLTESGYAFPMQLWVQAAAARLCVSEIPVKLIYNDPNRSFGGDLDDVEMRLAHYRHVLHCELRRHAARLPEPAWQDVHCPCPGF